MQHTQQRADEYTMVQAWISVVIVAFAMVLAMLGSAHAYDTRESDKPTDLRIYLTLKTRPIHNNFTRYLTFINLAGSEKSVAVSFTKLSELAYEGAVTAAGLATLQTLADHNNRSYWDTMYFENHGGSTSLDIKSFTAEIDYDDTCCSREPTATIAYTLNKELDSGHDSFYVPSYSGRMVHALNYFGWSWSEYFALPPALQLFIKDIGKSGSSGASDSVSSTNPKYASGGDHPLCSETVSWYYNETGVEIRDSLVPWITYDFRDITSHGVLHDAFNNSGRLYCFHSGREEWIRKNRSYAWVYGDTYEPQPGDYLNRRTSGTADGHSMMLVQWDASTGRAETLDGPYNINFRLVDVLSLEKDTSSDGRDFCVGRIPFND